MLTKVSKNGTTYRLGERLRSEKESSEIGMCPVGIEVELVAIRVRKEDDQTLLGVKSLKELSGWHDLDGMVPHGYGLWVTLSTVSKCFSKLPNLFKVTQDFSFRRKNLKGMNFRLLTKSADGLMLAEMEDHVGGGGGDGLGKAGHCVLLPVSIVRAVKK